MVLAVIHKVSADAVVDVCMHCNMFTIRVRSYRILTETKKQGNLRTLPQHFIISNVLISSMWIQPSVNTV